MKPTIDIIIPSFKGKKLLQKHLPDVLKHSPDCGIIVINDGPDDGTVEYLNKHFPKVKYLQNSKNLGFPKTINRGVAASKADYVVLMNNDVSPQKGYLTSALKILDDPKVFAVTFNEQQSSWPKVVWHNGKITFTRGQDKNKARYSAWASGGSSIIKRSLWKQLGGFNPLYSPGYWEDIDLGWRAWKLGFRIVWDPDSNVIHQHESTFKTLPQNKLNLLKQRNELLYHWQTITDSNLIFSHLKFLLTHTLAHPGYIKVILAALLLTPQVTKNYIRLNRQAKVTDRHILKTVNTPYSRS